MNLEEVTGIIVNETNYGETSKILNVITKEKGLISVMAKGCKNLKSPLRSVSSKLTYGTFIIYYKENKISTLKEVSVLDNFKNLKKDITSISYAAYMLELSEGVIKQNNDPRIFDLLIQSLKKIDEGFDPLVIMNILELKYLEFLGVMPIIDSCAMCGKKTGIVTLSSYRGGYVCKDCYTNETMVSDKTIKLIRMFYYVDISKITKLDISLKSKNEINLFLDDYYSRYTGLYLKSKSFIKNLQKLTS
ncbi:dNA repair protein RecO [Firmicutes bacterium CAG:822]|nr:dNA repair protein RecO [Firmicutes bacterium CAG:822]